MEAWEPWVVGLAPPLVIWLLWRGQTLSVEALRRALWLLREGHRVVYAVVSWFGTLLHEVSHATVLLLSGHGIKQFSVRSEQGHVLPARMSKGPVGFLFFLAAALAPLFIPALLVLLGLWWWVDRGLLPQATAAAGYAPASQLFLDLLMRFPLRLVQALGGLDLANWRHAIVAAIVLLGIPGARPSHVKGSRFHGTQDEGDVAVLRRLIRHNPAPFIAFLALLYLGYVGLVAYAPAAWTPRLYWAPVTFVAGLALTGITLALFDALWWGAPGLAGQRVRMLGWLCPIAFVAAQILMRTWAAAAPQQANLVALAAWLATGLAVRLAGRRRALAV